MSDHQAIPPSESAFFETLKNSLNVKESDQRSWDLFLEEISADRPTSVNQPVPDTSEEGTEELAPDTLKEIFCQKAKSLSIIVHSAASSVEAADIIYTIADSAEPEFGENKQLITHNHPLLSQLHLWQKFAGTDISVHTTFTEDTQIREKTIASYIGVTVAHFGIADCAALFQPTVNGQPRSTSLVPSIHIALLRKKNIVKNLQQAYTLIKDNHMDLSSFTLISGASKTADIEATMVHGAHGPRALHVIIVDY